MTAKNAKKVILDVDTGIDDALAILLALKSPQLEVMGITTVGGNTRIENVTRNTLQVLELAGSGMDDGPYIPVAKGMGEPISGPQEITYLHKDGEVVDGEYIHGSDGLANLSSKLPSPSIKPIEAHAVDFIIDSFMSNPKEITLITTAPLTNVALALDKEPRIAEVVKEHIMMGGAYGLTEYGHGNVTPVSEFNAWHDPLAADRVLSSMPTIAAGLDITHDPSVELKADILPNFSSQNKIESFVHSLLSFYVKRGERVAYPHDPIAVAVALAPEIFKWDRYPVEVETEGILTRGQTIVDRRPQLPVERKGDIKPEIRICHHIDGKKFMDLFINRLTTD
ncbi:MAG: nucleoside hydrolase [Archaeoglobaceae archaeon]